MEAKPCSRYLEVELNLSSRDGLLSLEARSEDGRDASVSVEFAETAVNRERAEALLRSQLSKKTDIYAFSLNRVEGELPHLGAAAINALRRELAAAIDAQAVKANPLLRGSSVSQEAVAHLLPVRKAAPGELMRSKYCMRHELGLCPKQCGKPAEDLVLVNNGRRFTLRFDCRACEMVII